MDKLKDLKELALGSRLKRLSDGLMKEMELVYKNAKIKFDPFLFPIYKIIADETTTTTSFITEKIKLSQPAVTQSINKLYKDGLIIQEVDKLDKRKKIIKLSVKGQQTLEKITPLWNIIDQTIKEITNIHSTSLIDQIDALDLLVEENTISKSIIHKYQHYLNEQIEIVPFKKIYASHFKDLNIEWLEKYFVVEPHDSELLENCQKNIIDKGGFIFFASINNEIVGCYAFIKINEAVYELGKMAVSPKFQGRKIGQKLLNHSINFAKDHQWRKIILYSNTKLENAIHLYKKFGFIEVSLEKNTPYLRSNIKMELSEYLVK
jgi:N-acetylglutamate synthase-like GNAT family acetyltransferase/DNA-binding MarR family transcriptional regulator